MVSKFLLSAVGLGAWLLQSGATNTMDKNKEVDIHTPVGSLTMRNQADSKDFGLSVYPGARLRPDSKGDDHSDNANINLATSLLGVKLIVQKYDSGDSSDRILKFYERELSKYGKVTTCKSGEASKCDQDISNNYDEELKVGSKDDQRIVVVKATDKGSSFTLIRVKIKS